MFFLFLFTRIDKQSRVSISCLFSGAWKIETSFSRLKETNGLEGLKVAARKGGGEKLKGNVTTLDGRRKSFSVTISQKLVGREEEKEIQEITVLNEREEKVGIEPGWWISCDRKNRILGYFDRKCSFIREDEFQERITNASDHLLQQKKAGVTKVTQETRDPVETLSSTNVEQSGMRDLGNWKVRPRNICFNSLGT